MRPVAAKYHSMISYNLFEKSIRGSDPDKVNDDISMAIPSLPNISYVDLIRTLKQNRYSERCVVTTRKRTEIILAKSRKSVRLKVKRHTNQDQIGGHFEPSVENLPEGLHLCECLVKVEKEVCLMFHKETHSEIRIPKRTTLGTISTVSSVTELSKPMSVSVPKQISHQPAQDDWDPPVNLERFDIPKIRNVKSDKYRISRNFSEDLILALLARLFSSLKLCIANNTSCLEIM